MSARTPSRRGVLASAIATLVPAQLPAAPHPDADLIRLCAQHGPASRTFADDPLDSEESPAWLALTAIEEAIDAGRPQTFEGLAAKARAARAAALRPDGSEQPCDGPACDWAWDLVHDVIRIAEARA